MDVYLMEVYMGRYPEFFYDDLPSDPCDSCACLVEGFCICVDGCGYCADYGHPRGQNRLVVDDSRVPNDVPIV